VVVLVCLVVALLAAPVAPALREEPQEASSVDRGASPLALAQAGSEIASRESQ